MFTDSTATAASSAPRELAQSSAGRTSGKPWKLQKTATKYVSRPTPIPSSLIPHPDART